MSFAPSYISAIVLVLSQILPKLGINLGSEELSVTIQTLIAIGTGLFVMYRQIKTKKSTFAGTRPR